MTDTRETTVKLCEIDALADGEITRAEVDGRWIAYAHVGDEWFAIDDTCSHAKVSLAGGIVDTDDLTIECPKHGAVFSLETGDALTLPAIRGVARHEVTVDTDGVHVTIAQEAVNES